MADTVVVHRVDIDTDMEDIKELLKERGMKIMVPCIPGEEIDVSA
jgi:hypothetical protein